MNKHLLTTIELSKASYDDNDARFITVNEQRFGVIEKDDRVYLIFRGTDNIEGWLHDLLVVPVHDVDGSLVHQGFLDALDELWPYILKELTQHYNKPICIGGHSLGAAIAVLAAKRLNAPVYTVGCPRVQSQFGLDSVKIEHYRVIIGGDPVTKVPDNEFWTHLVTPFLDLSRPGDINLDVGLHNIDLYFNRLTEDM